MKNLLPKEIWSSLQFTETEETINDRYNAACYSLKRKTQEMTYLRLTKSFKLKFICSVNRSMQITQYNIPQWKISQRPDVVLESTSLHHSPRAPLWNPINHPQRHIHSNISTVMKLKFTITHHIVTHENDSFIFPSCSS